jgi:hypothetical protein
MAASQGARDEQIANALRQGLPHHTNPASLEDQSFGKQPQGIGIQAEQVKKDYEQKKRTRTILGGQFPHTAIYVSSSLWYTKPELAKVSGRPTKTETDKRTTSQVCVQVKKHVMQ